MIVAAVDPGERGALAFGRFKKAPDGDLPYYLAQVIDVVDMPLAKDAEGIWRPCPRGITDLCQHHDVDLSVMEWPYDSAGASIHTLEEKTLQEIKRKMRAEFSFGAGCGETLTALKLLHEDPSVHTVSPSTWKRAMQLGSAKGESTKRACVILSDQEYLLGSPPSHDRAEAVLLLRYLEQFVLPSRSVTVV